MISHGNLGIEERLKTTKTSKWMDKYKRLLQYPKSQLMA